MKNKLKKNRSQHGRIECENVLVFAKIFFSWILYIDIIFMWHNICYAGWNLIELFTLFHILPYFIYFLNCYDA